MADLLQTGASWLSGVFNDHVSRSITYTRGAYSATFDATLGRSLQQSDELNRLKIFHGDRDYLFPRSLLVLNGSTVTPQAGDRITDNVDGKVYELRDLNGEPCFRPSDASRIDWRVHCFEVS